MSDPSSGPSSGKASSARPRQLTMAAGFVVAGSVFLVLTIFDRLTNLDSVDTREEFSEMLSRPPLEGSGLSVADLIEGLRVGLPIVAVLAAATAVLGIYVFQRHKGARLALSILAVPLLLGTLLTLTGGFLGALIAVSTLTLWGGPARDWFAGRPVRELQVPGRPDKPGKAGPWETTMPRPSDRLNQPDQAPRPGHDPVPPPDQPSDHGTPEDRPTPPASELTTAGSSTAPGASTGFGARPAPVEDRPQDAWPPTVTTPPPGFAWGADPSAVPAGVKIACILTWVFSGLVALMYAAVLVALIVARDEIVDYIVDSPEWKQANLPADFLVPALWLGVLMFLGWALAACVLAWFTWRRHNWARWLLATSAAAAFVAGLFAFPVGLLNQLAAALTIVGLFLSTSRTWFEQDTWNTWQGPPSGPPPEYPQGPPTGPGSQSPDSYPSGPPQDLPPQDRPTQEPPPGGKPPVW